MDYRQRSQLWRVVIINQVIVESPGHGEVVLLCGIFHPELVVQDGGYVALTKGR